MISRGEAISTLLLADDSLLAGNLSLISEYDLGLVLEVFNQDQLIREINLINSQGDYLAVTKKANQHFVASEQMLSQLIDSQNLRTLKQLRLNYADMMIEPWQYVTGLPFSDQQLFLQVLYDEQKVSQQQTAYLLAALGFMAIVTGLIIGLVVLIVLGLRVNLIRLSQLSANRKAQFLGLVDGEFRGLYELINGQNKSLQAQANHIAKLNLQRFKQQAATATQAKNQVFSRHNYSLLLLGIRLVNLPAAFRRQKIDQFSSSMLTIYQQVSRLLSGYQAIFLSFDGDLLWLGFKGDRRYEQGIKFVKQLLGKFKLLQEEISPLAEPLQPVCLLHESNLNLVKFRGDDDDYCNILHGKGIKQAKAIIQHLEHGDIWATADIKPGLKGLCGLSIPPLMDQALADLKPQIFAVSLTDKVDHTATVEPPPLKPQPDKNLAPSEGLMHILEDTLKNN